MGMSDSIMIDVIFKPGRLWRAVAGPLIGFLCLSLPGLAQSPRDIFFDRARRIALVIGNANYPGHRLANPVHDAEDMRAALKRANFTVSLGKDLSKRAMQDEVARFVKDLRDGDIAFFYYSGHGMQIDGENLLVPTDFPQAAPRQPGDTKAACFRFDDVQQSLEKSKARLSVLVIDACRTNPYRRTRDWDQGGPAPVEAGLGSYVAFAASPGQTADDNPAESNGLFTKFLLKELQQPPPLSQLFRTVRDNVYEASGEKQRPYLVDQVIGDFSFQALPRNEPSGPKSGSSGPKPEGSDSQTDSSKSESNPVPREDPIQEGLLLYRHAECKVALERFDTAIREDPENSLAQNAAGMAYVCLRQYSLAIPRFAMAIHLRPSFAAAYLNRGTAYSIEGQYELALGDFDWAVEQEPWNPVFYTRRGEAYFSLRKYEEALADFNRAIEINPAGADAFCDRGLVRERLGRYAEAAGDFDDALERNGSLTEAKRGKERIGRGAVR